MKSTSSSRISISNALRRLKLPPLLNDLLDVAQRTGKLLKDTVQLNAWQTVTTVSWRKADSIETAVWKWRNEVRNQSIYICQKP